MNHLSLSYQPATQNFYSADISHNSKGTTYDD